MVKPGGTGRPMRVISARFAPLPPRRAFMEPSPSARPLPQVYTYFGALPDLAEAGFFAVVFLALDLTAM
jgi:hypothetical protein